MVSFPRIAITTAIVLAAAAPAAAQGSFSELQGIRTEISPLNDLPEGPRALQRKPPVDVPGVGERFAGKSHAAGTTHKLRAGDAARSGDVLLHRWQRNGVGRP